ncbi:peptide-methionine (S)-S-oxide reductase MsrA [Mycobacterium canetti]|uniref:peptide-methionine (S)-S-oxide reductase MsrA n=1 Tax=Mycobacterium canetti TaxID=78331 RepID=UPI0002A55F28|nr:peptide-methionine (S)-S-oxide reductase MsrA [Mycobacterium canetti]CCK62211.1 Putative peptide methionine sulfoxide reductase MsrA (protein-methionine-S-oxide reductase) (peptide met(O) reductase) [Mycobacterium canettii CIPT 140070017]
MTSNQKAILAGGCFWGLQDLIRNQPGVVSTRVGYSGGNIPNATYRNHGTHAEAVEIIFDPTVTDYRTLLEFFFQIHDPTTKDRQGNDRGTSYRSAIFYLDDQQKRIALDTIADVEASGLWPGKVVTEVSPAGDFWEAEPEHQDYLQRYPNGYTCHFVRPGWKLPRRNAESALRASLSPELGT